MRFRSALLGAILLIQAIDLTPGMAEEVVNLPTRPGVTERVWLLAPATPPTASVILLTGGEGVVAATPDALARNKNFLVRSRGLFAAQGFLVAVVDVPSDHADGMGQFRIMESHARDVAAVIAYLRQLAAAPVWLIGTSNGTISAANVARRLRPPEAADGLVLTSSITAPSRAERSLPEEVDLAQIAIPTLMVHNTEDQCVACPFSQAPGVLAKITHAPRKELIAVSGGSPPDPNPCEPISRHGFLGIEDQVVALIAKWIKGG